MDRFEGATLHWRRSAVGAVAVAAGVTAIPGMAGPAFQRLARRRQALIAYLRDHLSGSDVALRVVHRLDSTHQGTEDGPLFRRLSKELEEDRAVVRTLLAQLGASGRSIKRAAGYASGTVLSVTAGGEPGDLSLLRTLEAWLSGFTASDACGEHCRASGPSRRVQGTKFMELEAKAVHQWEAIEERRRALVERTFSAAASRAE